MRDRLAYAQQPVGLSQQQYATIGCDIATVKTNLNDTAINTWKLERSLVTFRHGEPFLYSLSAL